MTTTTPKTNLKVTWNTGASYTREGQVITAQLLDDCVIFMDHSRYVCGTIKLPKFRIITDTEHLKSHVMFHYLRNDYDQSHWNDSMALKREDI